MIWLWLAVGFVAATIAQIWLIEQRSRELQHERFTNLVRDVDPVCRRAGWILVDAMFRPGYLIGNGKLTWRHWDGRTWTSSVEIDAKQTTNLAAHPWMMRE